jgi:hypothetical protein
MGPRDLGTIFTLVLLPIAGLLLAWEPVAVKDDPLLRMPGTQPDQGVKLTDSQACAACHAGSLAEPGPVFNYQGSMMAHAARDFLFWAALAAAAQDSIWATGTPNTADLCLRCHMPGGWLEGRSDPTNASAMTGTDFDGLQCEFCHRMFDPFFESTYQGNESNDWLNYWDETNLSATPSQAAADVTRQADILQAQGIFRFNGDPFYGVDNLPFADTYTANGGGQYFVSTETARRASFADVGAPHTTLYSRYHKSKYFCGSCHDVSNAVLANLNGGRPLDGSTGLTTEVFPAHSYGHVERTFSEFLLSDYGLQGGASGIGPYAPEIFDTSHPDDHIAKCQDCHMGDVEGRACFDIGGKFRPVSSDEHPLSGVPRHDLTGANAWVPYVLASAIPGSPNYDSMNDMLLNQDGEGPDALTLDLTQGMPILPEAVLAGVERSKQNLRAAASIEGLAYDSVSGEVSFRIQNHTGHKLITGFPEGRRMFVNIKAYCGPNLIFEVNPYDDVAATLKGLPLDVSPNSPPLGGNETHLDSLVYEMQPTSTLTGETKTFHFVLGTSRYKDNRIPPKGFRIAEAADRMAEPVWQGMTRPDYFSAAEYLGGYDEVSLTVVEGADRIRVNLYYQTTSREYVEFLRDEINGTGGTLSSPTPSGEPEAYIIQSDPFFTKLKAWGDTLWDLWDHNKAVPGAAPILMTQAQEPPPRLFQRADANVDGALDLSDAIATLGVIFQGVGEFLCEDAADSNDDGELDISDAINSLNYVFTGTGFIPPPGAESCGPDETDDSLGCFSYPPCAP